MSKVNFSLGIGLQLLLVICMFVIGLSLSNTKIALNKSAKTTGMVTYASTKTFTRGRSGYFTGFLVQTKNTANKYWVYRSSGDYDNFFAGVKPSTPVTIYHSETPQTNGYFDIYQLENGKSVVYSKEEYERKAKLFGKLVVIPLALALLLWIVVQIKQRYDQVELQLHS
jgi:hypothetical protein